MAAREAVLTFIEECHIENYVYDLKEIKDASMKTTFRATWSRPTKAKPVPAAVVYVTYTVENNNSDISYRIENETHVHYPGENIAFSEVWLDRILARKLKLKGFINMSTPFDHSRIPHTITETVLER